MKIVLRIFDVEHGACVMLAGSNDALAMIDCGHDSTTGWLRITYPADGPAPPPAAGGSTLGAWSTDCRPIAEFQHGPIASISVPTVCAPCEIAGSELLVRTLECYLDRVASSRLPKRFLRR